MFANLIKKKKSEQLRSIAREYINKYNTYFVACKMFKFQHF